MKKILYLPIILGIFFYSIPANSAVNQKPVTSPKNPTICGKHIIKDNTITIKCEFPDSKEHISTTLTGSFVFAGFTETEAEDDIEWIYPQTLIIIKNGKISQEINLKSIETGIRIHGFDEAVQLMDLNFDGYDDIKLWTSPSTGIDSTYAYWLYNSKTGLFDFAGDLGKKLFGFDVTPNLGTKTISVKEHSGCCYNNDTTYHWVGNELRKKINLYYGAIEYADACGQITSYYNDNEEIVREEIEPSGYCKGDEHNAPISLKPYISKLKKEEKDGNYVLKKKAGGKYTVIYKKPKKEKY